MVFLALSPAPSALGQVPQGFNYQAIARDGSGNPISDPINVKIAILSDDVPETVIWEELHSGVDPDEHGLFSIVVGQGTLQEGFASFNLIDWTVTPLYIRTKINDVKLGISQLWAVPYAMVADSLGGPLKNLKINAAASSTLDEALFEVRNRSGIPIFSVYNQGVRITFERTPVKGPKGGFSVGGFDNVKGTIVDYLVLNDDSTRLYVNDMDYSKSVKGGFAVGGFNEAKGAVYKLFHATSDSTRIYVNESAALPVIGTRISEGFAVKGYNAGKGIITKNFLATTTNSITAGKGEFNTYFGYESGQAVTEGSYNSFIGYQAGKTNTTGSRNAFFGYQSGSANISGLDNVFIGNQAGMSNTLGCYNVFIGQGAGYSNIGSGQYSYPGNFNVFLGYLSGYYNKTGQDNVFLGKQAGWRNDSGSSNIYIGMNTAGQMTVGSANVFIGSQAGAFKTGGGNNILIGDQAGSGNGTGSGNIFIGYRAGSGEDGSSLLYIENSESASPLIGGNFNADKVAINGVPEAAGATLQVNGSMKVGFNGSNISGIIKATVTKDLPAIATGITYIETFAVANSWANASVMVSPSSELPDGLVISYARVSTGGIVEVKFRNTSAASIDNPAMNWYITVIQ